uniref:Ankyrin homolog n=1 Tax=Onchocerca ochengi TaxID=42157 RepID=O96411_ONCOC|nr:ankyrin homolog [Onchocerca ochengi]
MEKQENFIEIAKSKDVEVLSGRHQFLEFSGNILPITKSGDQLSLYFLPFQENRLAFMIKTRAQTDYEAAVDGRIAFMKEPKMRAENLPPQTPLCTLAITLPAYTAPEPMVYKKPFDSEVPLTEKYAGAFHETTEPDDLPLAHVARLTGADWHRLARALEVPDADIRQVRHQLVGLEAIAILRIWIFLKKEQATPAALRSRLQRIGRDDVVREMNRTEKPDDLEGIPVSHVSGPSVTVSSTSLEAVDGRHRYAEVTTAQQQMAQEPFFQQTEYYGIHDDAEEPKEQPSRVSEIRTVVRTERHVHDSEDGPIVEERTITTTYEDDVAVNEEIVDRIVPLNKEEQEKWDRMIREAEMNLDQQETPKEEALGYQVIHEEKEGDDGTIQKTTEIKNSHVTQVLFDGAETSANEARSDSGDASTIIIPTSKEDNHVIDVMEERRTDEEARGQRLHE